MLNFSVEQVAVRTVNLQQSIEALQRAGFNTWVQDDVRAVHLSTHPMFDLGDQFHVELAFNYEIIPGTEYELLQLHSGRTCQCWPTQAGVCHFGFHVSDHRPDAEHDPLVSRLRDMRSSGLEVVQVSETTHHASQSTRRYRYAFAFYSELGAPVKIIQRIPSVLPVDESVRQGREMFAWLTTPASR